MRLTARNLEANASAIAEYLALGPGERAIQSLPMHYSYGLSVLNSHLLAGGTVVLTPHSFMRPEFWRDVDEQGATSFAGVPYMYETLHRLRFDPARHPTLRTFTQAGGALRRDLITHFHTGCRAAGARLVVMYGQTEATARISYVPPAAAGRKDRRDRGRRFPAAGCALEPLEGGEGSAAEMVYEGPQRDDGLCRFPGRSRARRRPAGRAADRRLGTVDDGGLLHRRRAGSSGSPSCSGAA